MIMSSMDALGMRSWRAQDKNLWKNSKGCEEKILKYVLEIYRLDLEWH